MPEVETITDASALAVKLLRAYLANNPVASDELAGLIRSTRAALEHRAERPIVEDVAATYVPAVSVRKSVASPDHILSLIDGKPYQTLKRHLTSHGLTAEGYRERYNLPGSYPMVAPTYAAKRREIAEKTGLGRRKADVAAAESARLEGIAGHAGEGPVETASVVSAQSAPYSSRTSETAHGVERPRKSAAAKKGASVIGTPEAASRIIGDPSGSDPALAPRVEKTNSAEQEAKDAPGTPAAKPGGSAQDPLHDKRKVPARRGTLGLFPKHAKDEGAVSASPDSEELLVSASASETPVNVKSELAKRMARPAKSAVAVPDDDTTP